MPSKGKPAAMAEVADCRIFEDKRKSDKKDSFRQGFNFGRAQVRIL